VIDLRQLTKRYGATTVVSDVSFTVGEGELVVLLGGSGSGKTTTLKMVNRLVEPSSGSVLIDGQDTRSIEPHLLRRRIGYVFQKVGLFPHMTVAENIAVTPTLLGWNAERIRRRVGELLELVELDPVTMRERLPAELSGGEQQRVGVARALAAEPRVVLLDEPFGALDALTRDRLQQSLVRLRKQLGFTAVFVTHDVAEALLLADRVGVLRDGRLLQLDTPRNILQAPADEYVRELFETPRRAARVFDTVLEGGSGA
jgi:osmoprotectant transport system ATP-binding protein